MIVLLKPATGIWSRKTPKRLEKNYDFFQRRQREEKSSFLDCYYDRIL